MRKNSRAYKLYLLGKEQLTDLPESVQDDPWLLAVAVMIDAATAKPKSKAKAKESTPMLYNELDILVLLPELEVTKFGWLNKQIKLCTDLRPTDPEVLANWVIENKLPWLAEQGIPFTYSMLCRKFTDWLEAARTSNKAVVKTTEKWLT